MCFFVYQDSWGVYSYHSCLSHGVSCSLQPAVGAQHLCGPIRGRAPCSHFEGGIEYLVSGCLEGMRNEGTTDLPQWCYLTSHATSSSVEGREERIRGLIRLWVNLS